MKTHDSFEYETIRMENMPTGWRLMGGNSNSQHCETKYAKEERKIWNHELDKPANVYVVVYELNPFNNEDFHKGRFLIRGGRHTSPENYMVRCNTLKEVYEKLLNVMEKTDIALSKLPDHWNKDRIPGVTASKKMI